jgi:hypothetical protein
VQSGLPTCESECVAVIDTHERLRNPTPRAGDCLTVLENIGAKRHNHTCFRPLETGDVQTTRSQLEKLANIYSREILAWAGPLYAAAYNQDVEHIAQLLALNDVGVPQTLKERVPLVCGFQNAVLGRQFSQLFPAPSDPDSAGRLLSGIDVYNHFISTEGKSHQQECSAQIEDSRTEHESAPSSQDLWIRHDMRDCSPHKAAANQSSFVSNRNHIHFDHLFKNCWMCNPLA